jgi:hypothetical protein
MNALFGMEPVVYVGLLTLAGAFLLGDLLGVLLKADWRFCRHCWSRVLRRMLGKE